MSEKIWTSLNAIAGTVAMWAVRQSPYPVPKGLDHVLIAVRERFATSADKFGMLSFADKYQLEEQLSQNLRAIPQYVEWNERKNGDPAPYQFTSRYDGIREPDDSFIDLCALERNVAMTIAAEASS